jgi:outer membrane protein assembly factor BamB
VNWKKDVGSLNASAPAYSHGVLFASTLEPGEVLALRASDGKLLWRHPLEGRTETSPLVHNGKVLVGCECGDVLALDPKNGKTLWSVPTAGAVKGGVAVDKDVAFIGNYAGQLYAIRVSDGHVEWEASSQGLSFGRTGRFYSTPAVAFGRVYAGNVDGRVYSFDEDSGALAWSHSTGGYVYAGPAVADPPGAPPTVYIGSVDHNFYALDAATGEVRWQKNVGGAILGAGSVVGETVYMSVIGDNIGSFGFDVKTGKQVFQSPFGEYNPVISDGRRLYLTGSSKVLALRPKRQHRRPAQGKHKHPHRSRGNGEPG